ncbi:MAG: polysaccharide pyruvyl transferase family protein [Sedimentisphaerales bacterium]|nr:polysaccharide pyruvyl transferase family protein [Sedimentisphaerales bacterium]
MTKVGIISYYKTINYGSVLQAYALQTTIRKMGYGCEHIRYSSGRSLAFRLFAAIRRPQKALNVILSRRTTRGLLYREFIDQYIVESKHLYRSLNELESANNSYETFVCGSDQIWAPNQFNERYYLGFVKEKNKKIAYAPSIGLPAIPDALKSRMASLINDIGFLSVREKDGAQLIRELTGIDVPVVLDPTLLLTTEEWLNISKTPNFNEPYILCHFLGKSPKHRELAKCYARATGLKTVVLPFSKCDYSWGDITLTDAGPREYLGLVHNANIIFTDSYHGMLFSLNLNRPFNVFMRFSESHVLCQNSRIVNILDKFNLWKRLVKEDVLEIEQEDDIDYHDINSMLDDERKCSIEYLRDSLQDSVRSEGGQLHE